MMSRRHSGVSSLEDEDWLTFEDSSASMLGGVADKISRIGRNSTRLILISLFYSVRSARVKCIFQIG